MGSTRVTFSTFLVIVALIAGMSGFSLITSLATGHLLRPTVSVYKWPFHIHPGMQVPRECEVSWKKYYPNRTETYQVCTMPNGDVLMFDYYSWLVIRITQHETGYKYGDLIMQWGRPDMIKVVYGNVVRVCWSSEGVVGYMKYYSYLSEIYVMTSGLERC